MNVLAIIMLIFAALGALDRIFGNKSGLGKCVNALITVGLAILISKKITADKP